MTPTDAPTGFEAFRASPTDLCKGCHFEGKELSSCPSNSSGLMWCEPQNRRDRTPVVFQAIKE